MTPISISTDVEQVKKLMKLFFVGSTDVAPVSRLIPHLVPLFCISVISYFRYSLFTEFLHFMFFTLKFLALIPT